MTHKTQINKIEKKLFLTIFIILLIYLDPAGGVNSYRYLDLMHSIVNEGTIKIDTFHYNTIDKAYYNDHYYAGAAPGPAFIGLMFYIPFNILYRTLSPYSTEFTSKINDYVIKLYESKNQPLHKDYIQNVDLAEFFLSSFFVTIMMVFFGALLSILVYRTLKLYNINSYTSSLIGAGLILGTPIFKYSTMFYSHVLATFFIFLSFYLILYAVKVKIDRKLILVSGFSAGTAVLVDYPLIPISLLLSIFFIYEFRNKTKIVMTWVISFIVPLLILSIYHFLAFGNPFLTPYHFPTGPDSFGVHIEQNTRLLGIGMPSLESLYGLTFSTFRGIFIFSPILLLSLYGIFILFKNSNYKKEICIISLIFVIFLIFNASMDRFWHAGLSFGPRYLIPIIPFMAIPLAFAVNYINKIVLYSFLGISFIINWIGVQVEIQATIFNYFKAFFENGISVKTLNYLIAVFGFSSIYSIILTYLVNVAVFITLIKLLIQTKSK